MVRSRSCPHASLINAISKRHMAEHIFAFADRQCPAEWAAATATDTNVEKDDGLDEDGAIAGGNGYRGRWRLPLPASDYCLMALLYPVACAAPMEGLELTTLRQYNAALANANPTPIKCYRVRVRGKTWTPKDNCADVRTVHRRTSLLRIQSSDRRLLRGGRVETFERHTYGVVEHFLLRDGPNGKTALASLRLVCSRHDATGSTASPIRSGGWKYFPRMMGCVATLP